MKFRIEKSDLAFAMQDVKKAITNNNANPILDGILIEVDSSKLRVVASDSTMQIESSVSVDMESGGAIILPGSLFMDIVAKLPNEIVEISANSSLTSVNLVCGNFDMNLQGEKAELYPEMPAIEDGKSFEISQHVLKDLILKSAFSVSNDLSRPILTGLLFEIVDNVLSIVALSNNRMAIRKHGVQFEGELSSIIPASSLIKIVSTFSASDDKIVRLTFGQSNVHFEMGSTNIYCSFLAGDFLKYKSIIPDSHKLAVSVDRNELNSALDRASLISRESDKKFVKLEIESDRILVNASSEMGNVREVVPVSSNGLTLEIAFNARFLQDVLSKLDDDTVSLYFQGSETAGIIRPVEGDDYLYLIAPVQF